MIDFLAQAMQRAYLLLGWFPEDTIVSTTALASLWGGTSVTTTLGRVNRLHKLSMLIKVMVRIKHYLCIVPAVGKFAHGIALARLVLGN